MYLVDHKNRSKNSFKDIVFKTAESFDKGISGKIQLNDAGDRIGEDYDFWRISKDVQQSHYAWKTESNSGGSSHRRAFKKRFIYR